METIGHYLVISKAMIYIVFKFHQTFVVENVPKLKGVLTLHGINITVVLAG